MPVRLHVPEDKRTGQVPLRFGLRFHGYERPQRDREAQMFVVLICATLWGWFWFQFLIGWICNLPAIYWFSGGSWFPPTLDFYMENNGPFPWSLAVTFVVLSVFASVLGLLGAWLWTLGIYGKWRMRFAVLIFCAFPTAWSIASLKAEYGVSEGLREAIARERELWHSIGTFYNGRPEAEWMLRRQRERVEELEDLLEEWESGRR